MIYGCLQNSRDVVEDQLLMVKGVISFTVDMASQRCAVRLRSDVKAEVSQKAEVIIVIKNLLLRVLSARYTVKIYLILPTCTPQP